MKKRLLLLPLLFVTTSCIPVDYNLQISYEEGAILNIEFYELDDTRIYYEEIEKFDELSYTGLVNDDYIDTLMQKLQNTTYIIKIPIFAPSDPNHNFYDDTIYINFADGQKLLLCAKLGVLYDDINEIKECWYGYNEELTYILEDLKSHLR